MKVDLNELLDKGMQHLTDTVQLIEAIKTIKRFVPETVKQPAALLEDGKKERTKTSTAKPISSNAGLSEKLVKIINASKEPMRSSDILKKVKKLGLKVHPYKTGGAGSVVTSLLSSLRQTGAIETIKIADKSIPRGFYIVYGKKSRVDLKVSA